MTSKQVVEYTEIDRLFPTFVWKYYLTEETYRRLNTCIGAKLDGLRPASAQLPASGVWQTEQNLHELEEFAELNTHIRSAAVSVLNSLKVVYESFRTTGCWANIAGKGGWHKAHSHPNNFLSGVYYVRAPAGANRITFKDPRIQRTVLLPPVSELDENNGGEVTLEVRDGMLIMFPAWLVHSVGINPSDEERISVSFNIMFSEFAESMSRPLWRSNIETNR